MFAWLFSMLYFCRRAVTCSQDVIDLLNTQQQCFQMFKQTKWFDSLLTAKGASLLHSRPGVSLEHWPWGSLMSSSMAGSIPFLLVYKSLFPNIFLFLVLFTYASQWHLKKGYMGPIVLRQWLSKNKAPFSSLVGSLAAHGITGCKSPLLNTLFRISLIHMWFICIF